MESLLLLQLLLLGCGCSCFAPQSLTAVLTIYEAHTFLVMLAAY